MDFEKIQKENEILKKRLAISQQIGLKGSDLLDFEAVHADKLKLNDKGEINTVGSVPFEEWKKRAISGKEGKATGRLMGNEEEKTPQSGRTVHVDDMERLSTADLVAIRERRSDIRIITD